LLAPYLGRPCFRLAFRVTFLRVPFLKGPLSGTFFSRSGEKKSLTSLISKTYPSLSEEPFAAYGDVLGNQRPLGAQSIGLIDIYGWFDMDNNEIYIGSAKNLGKRPFKHLYTSSHTNPHLFLSFARDRKV